MTVVVGQPGAVGVSQAGRFRHFAGFLRPASVTGTTTGAATGTLFMFW